MPEPVWGEKSGVVRFGEYELDARRGVLLRKGVVQKLQPQPFRVLELLVARAPEIVTREELGDAVWGAGVHVDLEQSLNYCIRQIRLVLNDTAANPKFVDTLPKQGYRFLVVVERTVEVAELPLVASVDSVPALVPEAKAKTEAGVGSAPAPVSRRRFLWVGGAGAGAAALAGGGVWLGRSLRRRAPAGAVSVVLPLPEGTAADDPGRALGPPVVAPDGSAVVVALKTVRGNYLFIRRLDTNKLVRMEGTLQGAQPFWSPDSQHLAFFADAKLKRIPAAGGSVEVLCDAAESRGGSWGKGGMILFGIDLQPIFRVAAKGGSPVAVTQLNAALGENSHRNPVFLPDGERFLYFARTDDPDRRGVYLDALERRRERQKLLVVDAQFALGRDPETESYYLLSQQAGKIVAQGFDAERGELTGRSRVLLDRTGAVSVSDTGVLVIRVDLAARSHLQWLDRNGQPTATLGETGDYWSVDLSPDGRWVVTTRHDTVSGQFRTWIASMSQGLLEPFSDSLHAVYPFWSSDGSEVYYSDLRRTKLLRRKVTPRGSEEAAVETVEGVTVVGRSPDGRYVAVQVGRQRALAELAWVDITSDGRLGPQRHRIGASSLQGVVPRFSPDGRWLAFASKETGSAELYVMDFPAGLQRRRISAHGGFTPRWRQDGKELFFVAGDGGMMSVQVPGGEVSQMGVPERLFAANLRLGSDEAQYDVSGDGQRFLVIAGERKTAESDVEMVLNWPRLFS